MKPVLSTSPSSSGEHSRENEILAEHESLLDAALPGAELASSGRLGPSPLRRVAPLILLVAVGAALALMPESVKDALVTGRSVANGASR